MRSRVFLGGWMHAFPEAHTLFMGESGPSLARKAAESVLKVQPTEAEWSRDTGYW